MDIKGLKNWVIEGNLEEKATSGFWNYFGNYQKDYYEDFEKDFPNYDSNKVDLSIDSVALRITNWPDEDYNHVVLTVRIHYNDKFAGKYRMVFNLDGTVEDDHLSLF